MRLWLGIAAVNGAFAVIAGAVAAHGLRAHLSAPLMDAWQTGARYHMAHSLAMGLAGGRTAPALFLAGIVLFCFSLYALALGAPGWAGMVTPVGGCLLIAGWICLALSAFRAR